MSARLRKIALKDLYVSEPNPSWFGNASNETENAKNFKIHILLKHSTEEKRKEELPYYCDICKFGTTIKSQYDKHILSNKHKKYTNIINEKAQE